MKKALSIILAFTLMCSVVVLSRPLSVSAALDDGDKLSVNTNLEIGTGSGASFTPITTGQTFKVGDVITVRIIPKSDFLCGVSSYVIMFDKSYFSVVGTNTNAFKINQGNYYYSQAGVGFSGSTIMPDTAWPASFAPSENRTIYKAIKASVQANSNSTNGGYPEKISGEWLFEFRLSVLKAINTGANARIWMDSRWFRSPGNTAADGYFAKCKDGELSSSGSSTTYNFKYDFSGADKKLPLLSTTHNVIITQGSTELSDMLEIRLQWYQFYKRIFADLDVKATGTHASIKWTSDNNKVLVDQTGHITNLRAFGRSANIKAEMLDTNGNVMATDTVKVIFYKFGWQLDRLQSQSIVSDNFAQRNLSVEQLEAMDDTSDFAVNDFFSGAFVQIYSVVVRLLNKILICVD